MFYPGAGASGGRSEQGRIEREKGREIKKTFHLQSQSILTKMVEKHVELCCYVITELKVHNKFGYWNLHKGACLF